MHRSSMSNSSSTPQGYGAFWVAPPFLSGWEKSGRPSASAGEENMAEGAKNERLKCIDHLRQWKT